MAGKYLLSGMILQVNPERMDKPWWSLCVWLFFSHKFGHSWRYHSLSLDILDIIYTSYQPFKPPKPIKPTSTERRLEGVEKTYPSNSLANARKQDYKCLSLLSPHRQKTKQSCHPGWQLLPSTLPETNSAFASKIGCGWNFIVSFWGRLEPIFRGKNSPLVCGEYTPLMGVITPVLHL